MDVDMMDACIRGKYAADMFCKEYSAAILSAPKATQQDFMRRYKANPDALAHELYAPLAEQMRTQKTAFDVHDIRRACDYIAAVLAAQERKAKNGRSKGGR
jgi:hypothetical protein